MMKKIELWVVIAAGIIFCSVLFYHGKNSYDRDACRFAAIVSTGGYYWEDIEAGIRAADEELGCFTEYMEYPKFDIDQQIELLKRAEYMKVDGIITVGEPESEKLNNALKEIRSKNIPVVLIDTDAKKSNRNCYIGSDNYEAGKIAAKKIEENIEGNVDILVVTSKLNASNQKERLAGFKKRIATQKRLQIVSVIEGETQKSTIDERVRETLEKYPSIKAIFCEESSSATQIGYIIEKTESYHNVKVIGFDQNDKTSHFLQNGIFLGMISQDGKMIGKESVEYLEKAVENSTQKTEPETIYTQLIYIDKNSSDSQQIEETESEG